MYMSTQSAHRNTHKMALVSSFAASDLDLGYEGYFFLKFHRVLVLLDLSLRDESPFPWHPFSIINI